MMDKKILRQFEKKKKKIASICFANEPVYMKEIFIYKNNLH